MTAKPTQQVYEELQKAYEFFNESLFEGRLPPCVITLQRQHDTYGYFSANQFQTRTGGVQAHEIALNPSYFAVRTIHETLSVLVREMVSLDQLLNTKRDKLPRRRYRNTEWADMCEQVGLMPTSTGLPGGRRVGDNVQTYVIEGGAFDVACSRLVDEAFTLSWVDRFPPKYLPEAQHREAGEGAISAEDCVAAFSLNDDDAGGTHDESGELEGFAPQGEAVQAYQAASGDDQDSGLLGDLASHTVADSESSATESEAPAPAEKAADNKPVPPPMRRFEPVRVESLQEQGIEPREQPKSASKTPFQCPVCSSKAWGKPSLRIGCHGPQDAPHEPQMMVAVVKELAKTA